jgi:prolyl 4-hydroxylase
MPLFLPNAKVVRRRGLELRVLDDFLTVTECRRLIALVRSNLRPSRTTGGKSVPASYRTSETADLGLLGEPLVEEIDRRICSLMGLKRQLSEPIQGQYYLRGGEYKAHTDYFKRRELPRYARRLGQRTFTFMVYLNECKSGGTTEFVKYGLRIKPATGRAVVWNNLHSGVPNPATRHRAMPVRSGYKVVLTKWFRSGRRRSVFRKDRNELLPAYTRVGFEKRRVPDDLLANIRNWYRHQDGAPTSESENVRYYVRSNDKNRDGSFLLELPSKLKAQIKQSLRPIVQDWAGIPVRPTYVYGLRIYRRHAVLKPHRDRLETHVLGIIINVDQKISRPWPLEIEDHYCRKHEIQLRPGEMLLYESARLLHSRSKPLRGELFANVFCHFMPSRQRDLNLHRRRD